MILAVLLLVLAAASLSASDVSPRPALSGAPLGTSRHNHPQPDALDASRSGAEVERRNPASGAPQAIRLQGWATHYPAPSRTDGAAGPALRRALGSDWRGTWVVVTAGDASVRVQLRDWCACGDRHGTPTLIDLPQQTFRELAPLSTGVVRVTVTRAGAGPRLPETSTE